MSNITIQRKSDGREFTLNSPFFVHKKRLNRHDVLNVSQKTSSQLTRTDISQGDYAYLTVDGAVEFFGTITSLEQYGKGSFTLVCQGYEQRLGKTQGQDKVYTNIDTANIADDILANHPWDSVNGTVTPSITRGANDSAFTIESFRTRETDTVYNNLHRLMNETGQDLSTTYTDTGISDIHLDNQIGQVRNITLQEDTDYTNPKLIEVESEADVFTVYGKQTGDAQIKATSGTGTIEAPPVVDQTISTEAEAQRLADQLRAERENGKTYIQIKYQRPTTPFNLGDTIGISGETLGLSNKSVRVTKITRGRSEDRGQYIDVEVSNPEVRRPLPEQRDSDDITATKQNTKRTSSYDSGSKNTITSTGVGNAKQGTPIRIPLSYTEKYLDDEVGNIQILSFTADYDVDPYRKTVGAVGETQVSPNLTAGTAADNHKHDPGDAGHVHSISTPTSDNTQVWDWEGIDTFATTLSTGWNTNVANEFVSGEFEYLAVDVEVERDFSTTSSTFLVIRLDGVGDRQTLPLYIADPTYDNQLVEHTFLVPVHGSISGDVDLDIYSDTSNAFSGRIDVYGYNENHTHDISALTGTQEDFADVDDNNRDPGVTGAADNHAHSVTIGDDVNDNALTNATALTFTVQRYDGSTWQTKNTVTVNDTLGTDLDLSDGGTLPDQSGQWRVLVETDASAPDLVKTRINLKHVVTDKT